MEQDFLFDEELYFASEVFRDEKASITGDEVRHCITVMRHSLGDIIYVTDGNGSILKGSISGIEKSLVHLDVLDVKKYHNRLQNLRFFIPHIKNPQRLEFAIEKAVELGITEITVFDSRRSVAKGGKLEKWNKFATSAMKQSLRSFRPQISYVESLRKIEEFPGEKILFDQKASMGLDDFLSLEYNEKLSYCFIFGPEGGFAEQELADLTFRELKLAPNRLRSETAVISAASVLNIKLS